MSIGKIADALAEVGAYRGASVKVICEVNGDRRSQLLDRFAELARQGKTNTVFHEARYACSLKTLAIRRLPRGVVISPDYVCRRQVTPANWRQRRPWSLTGLRLAP